MRNYQKTFDIFGALMDMITLPMQHLIIRKILMVFIQKENNYENKIINKAKIDAKLTLDRSLDRLKRM
jgi:hypothetical protein